MTRHFLVIGGQRCGTTYLHSLLDEHPDITMARPMRPEPKVFTSDLTTRRGRTWYHETYFSHARGEMILGEKSTSYIESSHAPVRARAMLGRVHIIVLVRDPVDRAVSNWRFSTDSGLEDRPLATALEENLAGARAWDRGATSVSPFAYLERGRFASYLDPWYASFPGLVRIEFLSDLVTSGEAVGDLYNWLGADGAFQPGSLGRVVNRSEEWAPTLDEPLLTKLRAYFANSDQALRDLAARELPW